jgi:putative intracellular protease/amidase
MPTIKDKSEPLPLIKAFADLQKKDPTRERTLMSICTGALFLGNLGLLAGLAATTHPDYYTRFENICKEAAQRDMSERTDVMEERYVVCNGRFDLGENLEENPYLRTGRRKSSAARKGSMSFKRSLTDKELHARRAAMKLAGLRVITAGGISCGIDASLYLVSAMVSDERAQEVARLMCYEWKKGVTVDAIDV